MLRLLIALTAAVGMRLVIARPAADSHDRRHLDLRRGARTAQRFVGVSRGDAPRFAAVSAVVSSTASLLVFAVFGGAGPAAITALLAPLTLATFRRRRVAELRRSTADAWPGFIEEVRIHATALGESIPTALFSVGLRGPTATRPGFQAANREWLLTADFARALGTLKHELNDATADLVCETLLVAHEVGGTGIERRLEALAADRRRDLHERKDADSRLAGARFARAFVLLVPGGMALAGMSIGDGRAAYRSTAAQVAVTISLALIALCWLWASSLMNLPRTERVFDA